MAEDSGFPVGPFDRSEARYQIRDESKRAALTISNSDEGEGGPPFLELKNAGTSIVVERQYGEDTRAFLTVEIDGEKFLIPLERA